MEHKSVFKKEAVDLLNIRPAGTYVDATLGGGGHAREILSKLNGGAFIGFDVDADAIKQFVGSIGIEGQTIEAGITKHQVGRNTVYLVNKNFDTLHSTLEAVGVDGVDGILADLGWSSMQLETVSGLSYQKSEEPLDMRLDKSLGVRAADLLNVLHKGQLLELFDKYADIRGQMAKDLVNNIIEQREIRPFETVQDLLDTFPWEGAVIGDVAARVFQALRIAVNTELSSLQTFLPQAFAALRTEGRLLVISFHSGEERIVADYLGELVRAGQAASIFDKGHLRPTVEELRQNISAHSAKLWGVIKK